ncbi:diaminopimelate decarboxylase [Dictyoglomus thermophilum]|uniref:Diaminopimelate decarboxylase n=1 Tax=Dictyoglomus thermophilum (strain ATCC 35947 / DSM 3960 / H-6-12) TaxID=309799 RepID=B5YEX1_DICT6|nr:diaminopimelate decarboxylase [Dictyoglomus thermophilum]ACI18566.1 diaminopimelate decarboxylase [Dictyoglomus thermophilum H-6-12]
MESKVYPITFCKDDQDYKIGGVSIPYLGEKHNTPLYILDKSTLSFQANTYMDSWKKYYKNNYKVLFAIKALPILEVIRIFKNHGLGALVSTGGELYIALSAGVSPENIYFHGNAKTLREIEYAIDQNIGALIIDNFDEYEKIKYLLSKKDAKINVLVRIIPNIEVNTHRSIRTGQTDTKFGLPIDQALILIQKIKKEKNIIFKGIHSHIGSQIFDISAYVKLSEVLSEVYNELKSQNIAVEEMSIGGGLGVAYTEEDNPPNIEDLAREVSNKFKETIGHNFTLICEPGRSLVGRAGITLYRIESRKELPNIRKYVSVDGGMSDNIRPSLYGAKYSALVITKNEKETIFSIAGKHCESGDILIKDFKGPWPNPGDYLITFTTGAYNFSMYTWYNATLRPAVVLVENGKEKLIVKRENYEDLLRGQL